MKKVLSGREKEVAVLIARGLKDVEIARELFISRRRVGELVASIKRKLEIHSRVQIGIVAYFLGLITFEFNFNHGNHEGVAMINS
ncbi:response regulator transcription factor [Bacillus cereus]